MHQIIAMGIALVMGVCGTLLVVYIHDLHARVKKLEKANQLRVPFKTQDELLDVMALLDTALDKRQLEDEIEQATRNHQERLLRQAKERLANALAVGTTREDKKGDQL